MFCAVVPNTISYESGDAHSLALDLNVAHRNCNRAGDRIDSGLHENFSSCSRQRVNRGLQTSEIPVAVNIYHERGLVAVNVSL
jgi:hypothetical protein